MNFQPTTVVFEGEWDMYIARTETGPAYVTFDLQVATASTLPDLPHCSRVLVRIHNPGPNGLPPRDEAEELDAINDSLISDLSQAGVLCRMVARITHDGVQESVFMVADLESFDSIVNSWWRRHPEREMRVLTHQGWEFYDKVVRPTPAQWQWIRDRRVVDTLLRRGSDPKKEHTLKFFFLGPAEALRNVEQSLTARGYEPSPEDARENALAMVLKLPLNPDVIALESMEHEKLAQAVGATYDGWGAFVVK